ncbi:bifunctional lysylphosphatidylglycerol flippase/synthetase MprF [Nocardia sp. NPDC003963]
MAYTTASPARSALSVVTLVVVLVSAYGADITSHTGVHSWFTSLALASLFVARGLHLRRPITFAHATASLLIVALANIAYRAGHPGAGFVLLAATGFVLVLPQSTRPQPDQAGRVAELVARTESDPLAPFALHSSKAYFFNTLSTAVIGYRTRFGIAVVGGDPVGDRDAFPELILAFSEFAAARGWRIAVLGASPGLAGLWQLCAVEHHGLHPVPIGHDVVLDVDEFDLAGRRFRNLRQAVSRTENAGVGTEVVDESALTGTRQSELLAIVDQWGKGRQIRGFSMILDHLLDSRHPNMLVIVANDRDGAPIGFQRYGISGRGRELSLDVPWRRKDAPNGVNERMIVDMVGYARTHDIHRISLTFAPFPEMFDAKSLTARLTCGVVHLGDPLIRLESLYRFVAKFHALSDQRYVLVRRREMAAAAAALITLEFLPHRRQH